MTGVWVFARMLAVAVLALALDRALARIGRRIAHARAHGRRRSGLAGAALRSARPLVAAMRAAVWLGFAWLSGEISPTLREVRSFVTVVGRTAITAPAFMLGERGYSILDVVELPLAILVACGIVKSAARVLEIRLRRSGSVDAGMRDTITLVGRCSMALCAALVILHAWGVDVRSLTIAASVIGVGIGFGLQNITSNFVSGLLVSFERPIRPGDFVKVGDLVGSVQRIGLRCTQISTLDHVGILVPNSHLLEKEVINWSHGDPFYRLRVPVPVVHGSNAAVVRDALLEAAASHRAVLRDPAPRVHFRGIGQGGFDFELLVWARDPKQQDTLLSDMNYRLEASLRAHGIEIATSGLDLRELERAVSRGRGAGNEASHTEASRMEANGVEASGIETSRAQPTCSALAGGFDQVRDTQAWTDAELDALLARMRGSNGVPIADRRFRLRFYRGCFVGSEAVDWLVRTLGVSREESVALGRALVARGGAHHVRHEHPFKDGHFFYRFRADQGETASSRRAAAGVEAGAVAS